MGRLAVSAVGLGIGAFFGFPGIGLAIGNIVGSLLFPVKQPDIVGSRLQELQVKSSAYGNPIPIHWGKMRTNSEVIWSLPIRETENRESVGGKGLGGGQTRITFTYSVSFEVSLGEPAPLPNFTPALFRIWAGPKLIYDARDTNDGPVYQFQSNITFYPGTETQLPDPQVEADKGIDDVSADRGIMKLHFNDLPLADFGNTPPAITAEVVMNAGTQLNNLPWVTEPTDFSLLSTFIISSFDRTFIYTFSTKTNRTEGIIRKYSAFSFRLIAENLIEPPLFVRDFNLEQTLSPPGPETSLWENGSGATICVDAENFIYLPFVWGSFSVNRYEMLTRIDGDSLQIVLFNQISHSGSIGNILDIPFRGAVAGNIHKSSSVTETLALYSDTVKGTGTGRGTSDSQIIIIEPKTLQVKAKFNRGVDFPLGVAFWRTPAIDSEGNAYYTNGRGAGDPDNTFWLMKVNPAGIEYAISVPFEEFDDLIQGPRPVGYDVATNSLIIIIDNDESSSFVIAIRFNLDTLTIDGRVSIFGVNSSVVDSASFGTNETKNAFQTPGEIIFSLHKVFSPISIIVKLDTINMVTTNIANIFIANSGNFQLMDNTLNAIINDEGADLLHGGFQHGFDVVTVRSVVEDLLERSGYTGADFNISSLDDLVDFTNPQTQATTLFHELQGYSKKSRSPVRNALEALASAFMFLLVESDWKVVAIDRKGDFPAGTIIPIDDMGPFERGQKQPDLLEESIQQEVEVPERVDVTFISEVRDYQEGGVHSKRNSSLVNTREEITQKYDISLTVDQAKQISEFLLYQAWIGRDKYAFTLPPKHLSIDPGDYLQIPVDGVNTRVFVETVEYGVSGLLRIAATRDDSEVFQSSTVTTDVLPPVIPNDELLAPPPVSTLLNMDIPLLRDADDDAGFYQGATGPDGYTGTIIEVSLDGGELWITIITYVKSQISSSGFATHVLSPGPTTIFDTINTLTVRFDNPAFTFQSTTEAALLINKTANVLLVGSEIIRFQTAIDNGDNTWTFSKLIRGRRGTEGEIGKHRAGDRVTLLNTTATARILGVNEDIGTERIYRATSINAAKISLTAIPFTNTAKGLWPYSPVHISSTKDITGRTIVWVRRGRLDNALRNFATVPLSEVTEDYVVAIFDNDGNELRSITTTPSVNGSVVTPLSQTAFYAEEDEQIDFGRIVTSPLEIIIPSGVIDLKTSLSSVSVTGISSPNVVVPSGVLTLTTSRPVIHTQPDGLLIKVYQISAVVGRGFPGEKRI